MNENLDGKPGPASRAGGASVELQEELAHLARALASSARRAEWRGQGRLAMPQTTPTGENRAPQGLQERAIQAPGNAQAPRAAAGEDIQTSASFAAVGHSSAPQPSPTSLPGGTLDELRAEVAACRACGLHKTRTQTVFQDGSARARVLFIGEAPGAEEDAEGVPFVGAAGRLLTQIIEKGMGLKRSEVAIANVLKCRPPGNRDPEAEEKASCTPFLDRQIELIDPQVLIPLGRHAAQHVLSSSLSISRLRGRIHELKGRKVIPTFHPAYLLRYPEKKSECWADIQVAMQVLGLGRPS